jgi:hypothetical protein
MENVFLLETGEKITEMARSSCLMPVTAMRFSVVSVTARTLCICICREEEAMCSMQFRLRSVFLSLAVAGVVIGVSARIFAEDTVNPAQPKQSSFQVRNVVTVQVPKGSKTVRLWFAVPQEDRRTPRPSSVN